MRRLLLGSYILFITHAISSSLIIILLTWPLQKLLQRWLILIHIAFLLYHYLLLIMLILSICTRAKPTDVLSASLVSVWLVRLIFVGVLSRRALRRVIASQFGFVNLHGIIIKRFLIRISFSFCPIVLIHCTVIIAPIKLWLTSLPISIPRCQWVLSEFVVILVDVVSLVPVLEVVIRGWLLL